MSELNRLTAQREEVLAQIRTIEASCEGIENENNAKRIQTLNLEQAKLTAQKNELSSQLAAIQSKLTTISSEIAKLSGTGIDRILEAIKNQRWYFFKNKTKIMFDKRTGLLWPNLNYFNIGRGDLWGKCEGPWSDNSSVAFVDNLSIDNFLEWKLPTRYQLQDTLNTRDFPFFDNNYDCCIITNSSYIIASLRVIGENRNSIAITVDTENFSAVNLDCGVFPCNQGLICKGDYANNIKEENHTYTEKERLQFTLDLFVQNELWPIFADDEITQIYKQIYFEKPVLLKQLQELQKQIESLQTVTLLSSEFDYTALLNKYDIKAIDASLIKYYQAVQAWTDELLDKLDYYEQEKESVIRDFNVISLKLSRKYEKNANLTTEENELLESRQRYFQKKFSLGMNSVKTKILAVKKQAEDLEYRIEQIDNADESLYALATLEQEQRVSFSFLAENTAKIIRNALLKIEYFEAHHQFVMNAIEIWEKWTDNYRIFKTSYKEDLKASCEEDGIEEAIWGGWYKNWQNIRLAIEYKVQPIIERGLKSEIATVGEIKTSVIEQIIDALENYKKNIDKFFLEDRKGIYQKFVFQAGGELQEKFEAESELYKYIFVLQTALQEIIFNCKNTEDRVFILKWANSLLDIQIDEILDFVANNELEKISQTVLSEFATLKQKNYDVYLADAKAYSEEKSRREKQYNSLIFKMRKDLIKA